jgi:hypothetical protein
MLRINGFGFQIEFRAAVARIGIDYEPSLHGWLLGE